jgi:hypothetical protein
MKNSAANDAQFGVINAGLMRRFARLTNAFSRRCA